MSVVSFRGLMTEASHERLKLSTLTGKTGYKIRKLQIISSAPYVQQIKGILKVYKDEQSGTPDGLVNFGDQTLLGVSTYHDNPVAEDMAESETIIFDNITFNQDIFLTYKDVGVNGVSVSYYIELEKLKLTDLEATFHTLQSIKTLVE
jgi:hypothetical protein